MSNSPISAFMTQHYRHFNAATTLDAAKAYREHLDNGGKMFLTLAGAMSTAELGLSLAEMIREDKVHAICCTGANLEEDIYNLVAHEHYERIPNYRHLSAQDEIAIRDRKMSRVTDTCIPEDEAMRKIENKLYDLWKRAEQAGESYFPHEYLYQLINEGMLKDEYQIDPKNSWVVAASEKNLPIFVPGWEDSTIGNDFVAEVRLQRHVKKFSTVKNGFEQMDALIDWYSNTARDSSIGFFQIGGGIAGDFPICVVPLINLDIRFVDEKIEEAPFWGYFCQISDSTTSYGSYSGAVPNEKISWGKLDVDTPQFLIESDATIVAPLIFAYVLGW